MNVSVIARKFLVEIRHVSCSVLFLRQQALKLRITIKALM